MTPDEAIMLLDAMDDEASPEDLHREADDILCAVLRDLGHDAVAKAYRAARNRGDFWYA